MRIYLVGMMGAGKSFIGKKLAAALSVSFLDLDEQIEHSEEMSISDIFKNYGEAYFRSLEKKYLRKSSSQNNIIVATGGGVPCFNENMNWINDNGWSIYLKASTSLLVQRLRSEVDKRPILKGLNDDELELKINKMLQNRVVFYENAHIVWDQDHVSNKQANELLLSINKLIW